jgi:hypothetical protein
MNTAAIGHNMPPEPTPFEAVEQKIFDLYDEAKQWLDGEPVSTQGQADALNKLINLIRDAEKEADALRKEEVKPFDDGKAEVQARYAPLIADTKSVKGKTVLALAAAKEALTPWLTKVEEEKRESERKAREEAEAAQRAAQEALRAADAADLSAREEAERLVEQAKKAEIAARVAAKDKGQAKGGEGRATGLCTYYVPEITDAVVFARHLWQHRRPEMDGFLNEMAGKMVAQNHDQTIPGVTIHTEKRAV